MVTILVFVSKVCENLLYQKFLSFKNMSISNSYWDLYAARVIHKFTKGHMTDVDDDPIISLS